MYTRGIFFFLLLIFLTPLAVRAVEFAPGPSQAGAVSGEHTGNTPVAGANPYQANAPWQDFEVHFFIALPFAALYSYAALVSLESAIQGSFSPQMRQTDLWTVMGMALGGGLAVALGSPGRIPDQGASEINLTAEGAKNTPEIKFTLAEIDY